MSVDVRNQLESYYSTMIAEQGAVTPDEVATRTRPVRPLPLHGEKAPRWVPLVVAASVAITIAAVVAIPLLVRSQDESPPATNPTVTTTSVPPPSSTTTTPSDGGDAANALIDGEWQKFEELGAGPVFALDGTYIRIDDSRMRFYRDGEEADQKSYGWISDDGTTWSHQELPDTVPFPSGWSFDPSSGVMSVYGPAVQDAESIVSSTFTAAIDRSGDMAALVLTPVDADAAHEESTVAVIPDMRANGIVPTAVTNLGASWQSDVGDVSLTTGAISFELPKAVIDRLPEWNGGEGCCGSETARTGSTERFFYDGKLVFEEVWSVDGQGVSVEVIVHGDEGPETIHTGWVDVPREYVVFSSGRYGNGFGVDVLWRSADAGTTYYPVQPDLLVSEDAQWGPGFELIAHNGEFLWYVEKPEQYIEVWSSNDGLDWTLASENAGWFEVHNIVRHGDLLLAPWRFGAFVSVDGLDWSGVKVPVRGSGIESTDHGFVTVGTNAVYLSVDAETWTGMSLPEGLGTFGEDFWVWFVGDLIVVEQYEDGSVWIGGFPEV